ncbi:hypothetical protein ACFPRL_06555 [Pseudoclavibacter helvolus]
MAGTPARTQLDCSASTSASPPAITAGWACKSSERCAGSANSAPLLSDHLPPTVSGMNRAGRPVRTRRVLREA